MGCGLNGLERATVGLHRISVVVPVLDEAQRVERQLRALLRTEGLHEILVVDGGSSDSTPEIAASIPGVRLLRAPRGRAAQMNAAAAAAAGDVLLFLHADVQLPADAAQWVERALADPRVVAGAFRTWTVADDGRAWFAPLLHLADLRSRYSRLPYGDQALFVRAAAFRRVNGYPPLPIMEDWELARRLRQMGRVRVVPARVQVSGRRFVSRPLASTLAVNLIPLAYRIGLPPELLAQWYRRAS